MRIVAPPAAVLHSAKRIGGPAAASDNATHMRANTCGSVSIGLHS